MSPLASSSVAGGEGQLSCSRLLVPCHLNMKIHSLKRESADLISCPPPGFLFLFFFSTLEPPNLSEFVSRLRRNVRENRIIFINI